LPFALNATNDFNDDLRRAARSIFDAALAHSDARLAVRRALNFTDGRLTIVNTEFDLRAEPLKVYSIAIGKAGRAMASALDEVLGDALACGVVSAPPVHVPTDVPTSFPTGVQLSRRWQTFAGGHPLPNEASLAAACAAFALLREADAEPRALVIFLISGGGSAMLEWPRDEAITLAELRAANRALVSCGANVNEINSVRRAFSSVKGGGLSARAGRAAQISLIISDTNAGEPFNVASGPTYVSSPFANAPLATAEIVKRYRLASTLPASILRAINQPPAPHAATVHAPTPLRAHHVLLDNERAVERAAQVAAALGFVCEIARDVSEDSVEAGAAALVSRLFDLRRRESLSGVRPVCLISGGEFSCPVRGEGVGGRNAETVLRCAFEIEAQAARASSDAAHVVVLSAGTDGIDGNSPAAGAVCDETTLARARALSLDARKFLEASDAHTFFAALDDTIRTGATGTNVRDLRVLIAR
jgi:hydroxypyruvate reductase